MTEQEQNVTEQRLEGAIIQSILDKSGDLSVKIGRGHHHHIVTINADDTLSTSLHIKCGPSSKDKLTQEVTITDKSGKHNVEAIVAFFKVLWGF